MNKEEEQILEMLCSTDIKDVILGTVICRGIRNRGELLSMEFYRKLGEFTYLQKRYRPWNKEWDLIPVKLWRHCKYHKEFKGGYYIRKMDKTFRIYIK